MNRATLVSRPENSDDLRRKMLNTLVAVVVVLLAVMIVGCGGGGDDDLERQRGTGTQSVGPRDTGGAGAEMPGSSSMSGTSMQSQAVTVTLKDGEIAMATILKPGPTTLNVVNAGTKEHSLRLEGNGQEVELNSDLDPSKAAAMDVDLIPGTYTVRCTVDDHAETLQLTVQP